MENTDGADTIKRRVIPGRPQAPSSKLQAPSLKLRHFVARHYVTLTQDIAATLCHIDTRCSGVAFRLQS